MQERHLKFVCGRKCLFVCRAHVGYGRISEYHKTVRLAGSSPSVGDLLSNVIGSSASPGPGGGVNSGPKGSQNQAQIEADRLFNQLITAKQQQAEEEDLSENEEGRNDGAKWKWNGIFLNFTLVGIFIYSYIAILFPKIKIANQIDHMSLFASLHIFA